MKNRVRNRRLVSRSGHCGPRTDGYRSAPVHCIPGVRCTVPQCGELSVRTSEPHVRHARPHGCGTRDGSSSQCRRARRRPGGTYPRGLRQYPFGYRDARQRNNESALSRTCHVGLPSGFAARGGTDNDKPGILFPFHRKACLRRPFRTVGASHGHDRNIGSGGFHYGAYEPAACMRSRWPADVGLRYQTGRVSEDGFNAYDTMGGLFANDRSELSIDDCVAIYEASYK